VPSRHDRDDIRHDWVTFVGEDLQIEFSIVDQDGTAVDCTDASDADARGLVKNSVEDADSAAVDTFTFAGWSGTGSNENVATLADMSLDPGTYYYAIHVELDSGHADYPSLNNVVMEGTIEVIASTTSAASGS